MTPIQRLGFDFPVRRFAGDNVSALILRVAGNHYFYKAFGSEVDYGRDTRIYFLFNFNFRYSGGIRWVLPLSPEVEGPRWGTTQFPMMMSGMEARRISSMNEMYAPLLHQCDANSLSHLFMKDVNQFGDAEKYLVSPKTGMLTTQDTDQRFLTTLFGFTDKATNAGKNANMKETNPASGSNVVPTGVFAPVPIDIGRSFISEVTSYYRAIFGDIPAGYSCWDYARGIEGNDERKLRMSDTMAELEKSFKVMNKFVYRMAQDEINKRKLSKEQDADETIAEVNYVMEGGLLVNVNAFFHTILVFYSNESHVDAVNSCARFYKKRRKAKEPPKFYLLTHGAAGFTTTKMALKKFDLDLKANYNDDLPTDEIEKFIMEKTSSGLCLLHGTPGTGKTYYLRDLIRRMKGKKFIYMDKSALCYIGDSSFVQFLIENKDSVFIMEDCEAVLKDRAECNNVISVLLNLSDGMMGDAFNNKFICTFNTDISKIDKALIRKGRTRICYEFKPLKAAKATALARKLGSGKEYSEATPLCEVMNEASNGTEGIGARKERKVGF